MCECYATSLSFDFSFANFFRCIRSSWFIFHKIQLKLKKMDGRKKKIRTKTLSNVAKRREYTRRTTDHNKMERQTVVGTEMYQTLSAAQRRTHTLTVNAKLYFMRWNWKLLEICGLNLILNWLLFPLVSTQYIEEMKLYFGSSNGWFYLLPTRWMVVSTVASITDVVSSVQLFVRMYVERYW